MPIRRKIRLPFALRVFVLALFALSMLLQPVMASVSEIHQFTHTSVGHGAQAGHPGSIADESVDDPTEPGSAGTLHVLLHLAHCCGQSPAMATPALVMPPPMSMVACAAAREPQAHPELRTLAPFRPPTTA